MSTLIYNGIAIKYCNIREFSSENVYTEDRVSILGTRIRMMVEGILSEDVTDYSGFTPAQSFYRGGSADVTKNNIEQALMVPRCSFQYIIGGNVVFNAPAFGMPVDVDNGPKPLGVKVDVIANVKTWSILYAIEAVVIDCRGNTNYPTPIIAHRFTQLAHIDDVFMMTRVTRGTVHFRTDILANINDTVQDYRDYIFSLFPMTFGYKRQSINIGIGSDNKTLVYEFTDKEMTYDIGDTNDPNSGIARYVTNVGGIYKSGLAMMSKDGNQEPSVGVVQGQCVVSVTGNRQANLYNLTQYAIILAYRKFNYSGFTDKPPMIIYSDIQVIQHFSANEPKSVQVSLSAQIGQADNLNNIDNAGAGFFFGSFTYGLKIDNIWIGLNSDQGVNPSPPHGYGGTGSSQIQLLQSGFENLCKSKHDMYVPGIGSADNPGIFDGPPPPITVSLINVTPSVAVPYQDRIPDSKSRFGLTTEHKIDIEYKKDTGRVYMPVGGVTDSYSGLAGSSTVPAIPKIVTLYSPSSIRRVHWAAERVGAYPQLPIPEQIIALTGLPATDDFVLLDTQIGTASPTIMVDGSKVFRVEGVYTYGSLNATGAGDRLYFGATPNLVYPYGLEAISDGTYVPGTDPGPSDYYVGLIDPNDKGPGGKEK